MILINLLNILTLLKQCNIFFAVLSYPEVSMLSARAIEKIFNQVPCDEKTGYTQIKFYTSQLKDLAKLGQEPLVFDHLLSANNIHKIVGLFSHVIHVFPEEQIKNILLTTIIPNLARFSSEQQSLMVQALSKVGLSNLVILMHAQGFHVNDKDLNRATRLINAESKDIYAEEKLAIAKITPLLLDKTGVAKRYGGTEACQHSFVHFHRQQVLEIVDFIRNELRTPDDAAYLLGMLAKRRQRQAYLQHAQVDQEAYGDSFKFGFPRSPISPLERMLGSFDGTPLQYQYENYGKRIYDCDLNNDSTFTNSYEDVCLASIKLFPAMRMLEHIDNRSYEAKCTQVSNLLASICNMSFANQELARPHFAKLHWLSANIMLWKRGSAAIFDQVLDGLWISFFKTAPEKQRGISIDLEALNTPLNEYVKCYPYFSVPKTDKLSTPTELETQPELHYIKKCRNRIIYYFTQDGLNTQTLLEQYVKNDSDMVLLAEALTAFKRKLNPEKITPDIVHTLMIEPEMLLKAWLFVRSREDILKEHVGSEVISLVITLLNKTRNPEEKPIEHDQSKISEAKPITPVLSTSESKPITPAISSKEQDKIRKWKKIGGIVTVASAAAIGLWAIHSRTKSVAENPAKLRNAIG